MDSFYSLVITVLLAGLEEVVFRSTQQAVARFKHQYIPPRATKEETDAYFDDAGRTHTFTHLMCYEMLLEYPPLLGAGAVVVAWDGLRFFVDLGYVAGTPTDALFLLGSTVFQLVVELCVDALCVFVEKRRGIDIEKVWRELRPDGFLLVGWICSFTAFYMFIMAFVRIPGPCG